MHTKPRNPNYPATKLSQEAEEDIQVHIAKLRSLLEVVLPKEELKEDRIILSLLGKRMRMKDITNKELSLLTDSYTRLRKEHINAPGRMVEKLIEALGRLQEKKLMLEPGELKPTKVQIKLKKAKTQHRVDELKAMALDLGEDVPTLEVIDAQ